MDVKIQAESSKKKLNDKKVFKFCFTCLTWQAGSAEDVWASCVENAFPPQNCYPHQVEVIQVDCDWHARTSISLHLEEV